MRSCSIVAHGGGIIIHSLSMRVNIVRNGGLENASRRTNWDFPAHSLCSLGCSLGGSASSGSGRTVLWMGVSSCAVRTSFTNRSS